MFMWIRLLSLFAIIGVNNYCYCPILSQYVLIIIPLHLNIFWLSEDDVGYIIGKWYLFLTGIRMWMI